VLSGGLTDLKENAECDSSGLGDSPLVWLKTARWFWRVVWCGISGKCRIASVAADGAVLFLFQVNKYCWLFVARGDHWVAFPVCLVRKGHAGKHMSETDVFSSLEADAVLGQSCCICSELVLERFLGWLVVDIKEQNHRVYLCCCVGVWGFGRE
ncbi:MAG: hypothetical protein N3G20_12405, partial [Verrucomicrobiae bacterium]|nr:hypothetical protein [Verrucomicrobiae bacterium]